MKHIKFFLAAVASVALLSSCLFQEEDVFDESAALRSQHMAEDVASVLAAPQYGWVMQYFATTETSFEYYDELAENGQGGFVTVYTNGCNIYCKFSKNGICALSSDHQWIRTPDKKNNTARAFYADTTLYEINEQDGPVLSFCSWNDIISVFCDPTNPYHWDYNMYGDHALNGEGLHGDNEFIIKELSDKEIVMKGQRHEAIVRLIRLDIPADEYRAKILAVEKRIANGAIPCLYISGSNGTYTDTIFAYGAKNSVLGFSYTKVAEEAVTYESIVTTPNGFRFQHPAELSFFKVTAPRDTTWWKYSAQEFTFSPDEQSLVSDGGNMRLIPDWQGYIGGRITSIKNIVDIEQKEGDEVWQKLCADLDAAIKAADSKQSLLAVTFGNSTDKGSFARSGLCFKTKSTSVSAIESSISVDQDIVTFKINKASVSNTFTQLAKKGLEDKLFAVADYVNGSWTMVCDDNFAPTRVVLTNTEDASKVMVLSINQ